MRTSVARVGLLVVALCAATGAYGNWIDNFDGGTFDRGWVFSDGVNPAFASPGDTAAAPISTFEAAVVTPGDYLAINATTGNPLDATLTFGLVPEVFSNVWVTSLVNVDNSVGSNCDIGLVARGNPAAGNAYVLTIDMASGALDITKVSGLITQVGLGQGPDPVPNPDSTTYFLEFEVRGLSPVQLFGRVFEDATKANLIAEVYAEDAASAFAAGVSGVLVAVNEQGSPPTVIGGTFDRVSAQAIPEPGTLSLLALGGIAGLVRRRKK